MHFQPLFCTALLPLAARAANLVLSNDDGWAEKNIRVFYDQLTAAGESVVLSAPADNKSGSGSSTGTPSVVTSGCEFSSCAAGSPAVGSNSSNPNLNYVNSYPATAMQYGIQNFSTEILGGPPVLAVAGPNVGGNLGLAVLFSGTVGAALEATKLGVPGIAFSGASGSQTAWTAATELYELVYAELATNITTTLLNSGAPYLPSSHWLNVNFPAASATTCSSAADFKFVLSSIYGLGLGNDVKTCGSSTLPSESKVIGTSGCYASISLGDGDKLDSSSTNQAVVLSKLSSILSCLP